MKDDKSDDDVVHIHVTQTSSFQSSDEVGPEGTLTTVSFRGPALEAFRRQQRNRDAAMLIAEAARQAAVKARQEGVKEMRAMHAHLPYDARFE